MPETYHPELPLRCPDCDRKLPAIPFFKEATHVCRRTCPGCRERWFLKVVPRSILGGKGTASILEWTRITRKAPGRMGVKGAA